MSPVPDDSTRGEHGADVPAAVPLRPLWRNRAFLTLWAGQTVSLLGSQVTLYALPLLAVLTLRATPVQMAFLRAMEYVPAILIGLFAGVWVDRIRRRPILIGADLAQAMLLASLPIAAALGQLRIEMLIAAVFLMAVVGMFAGVAYGAFLPALVPHEHLVEANSKLATSNSVALIAGPGLAGGLVQLLTAPSAVVVDALSFLASALSLSLIRAPDAAPPRPEQRPSIWAEIGEGLRVLGGNPFLRAFVASSATLDVFWNALMAVYFLYVTRDLRLPPIAFGLIFGLGSVGGLLGSLLASRVSRRFGLGRAVIGAQLVLGLGGLLIALAVRLPAAALPLLVAAELVQSCMSTIYGINRESLSQAVTPDRLRGRVGASRHFIGLGVVPIGSLLGGVLGERIGVPATMVVGACGGVLAFVWLLLSPLRTLRELPL